MGQCSGTAKSSAKAIVYSDLDPVSKLYHLPAVEDAQFLEYLLLIVDQAVKKSTRELKKEKRKKPSCGDILWRNLIWDKLWLIEPSPVPCIYIPPDSDTQQLNELVQFLYGWKIRYYVHVIQHHPSLLHMNFYYGCEAIHCAASNHPRHVPVLLELGAHVDILNDEGCTPLDCAYHMNFHDSVVCLLKHGASTRIGRRRWLGKHRNKQDKLSATLLRRCHYLSLLSPISKLLDPHRELVIHMLV